MIPKRLPAIFCITGFREGEEAFSGTEKLHGIIRERFGDVAQVFDLRPWDHDWKALAAMVSRQGIREVIVIGYSWGGGFGAQVFARELEKHGIVVVLMGLCDAVFRPLWLWKKFPANVLSIRSILPGSAKIEIAKNVMRVFGVYQTETVPKGHTWKIPPHTVKGRFRKLPYPHTTIDEAQEWHEMVVAELELYFETT